MMDSVISKKNKNIQIGKLEHLYVILVDRLLDGWAHNSLIKSHHLPPLHDSQFHSKMEPIAHYYHITRLITSA